MSETPPDPVGTGTARRIVVGVDGSPRSHAALGWAVHQAGVCGARVHAIAVAMPPSAVGGGADPGAGGLVTGGLTTPGVFVDPAGDDEAIRARAGDWLEDAIGHLPPGAGDRVDRQVAQGDPVAVLLDAARDAELLVVGNAGRGALAGAITGSVALSCAHHAGCPVVLVPDRRPSSEPDATPTRPR